MRRFRLILIVITCLILIGCNSKVGINSDKNEKGSSCNSIEKLYLTENNINDFISIQIPFANFDEVQIEHIKKEVSLRLFQISGKNFDFTITHSRPSNKEIVSTEYYLDFSSNISYRSQDMVSIVFKGIYNKKDAAHPLNLFFCVNFNPQTLETIYFHDNYVIDDELYDVFSKFAKESIIEECNGFWPEQFGEFSEEICIKEEFINGLKFENTAKSIVSCYYTKNGVGFSYQTVSSLGGHKEVVLPFSVLRKRGTQGDGSVS